MVAATSLFAQQLLHCMHPPDSCTVLYVRIASLNSFGTVLYIRDAGCPYELWWIDIRDAEKIQSLSLGHLLRNGGCCWVGELVYIIQYTLEYLATRSLCLLLIVLFSKLSFFLHFLVVLFELWSQIWYKWLLSLGPSNSSRRRKKEKKRDRCMHVYENINTKNKECLMM
jgi:hypothetical protein